VERRPGPGKDLLVIGKTPQKLREKSVRHGGFALRCFDASGGEDTENVRRGKEQFKVNMPRKIGQDGRDMVLL